jgi:Fur family ferric uptake transcriptional regulator
MNRASSRMTKQRRIILEALRSVTTHPTAEELYAMVRERLPRISLGTVYRNLDFLTGSGAIRQLASVGSVRRFDGDTGMHYHVRCAICGRVGDVRADRPPVASAPDAGLRAEGFVITGSRMEFDGLCAECLARSAVAGNCLPPAGARRGRETETAHSLSG